LAQGLLLTAAALYVFGVQLPTFRGNVPLNNRLQRLDLSTMSDPEISEARRSFEPAWNRLNIFRTIVCVGVGILLILVVLLR